MGKRGRHAESITEVVPLLDPSQQRAVASALERHRSRPGALLPILHEVQDLLGYVPAGAVAPIAAALNVTRADVHGVISFYHEFRDRPPARHVARLCAAEACQAMGARMLEAHARRRLALAAGVNETVDRQFALEPVYCLGNCALAPAMTLDGKLHGRVSPQRFDELLATCSTHAEATP